MISKTLRRFMLALISAMLVLLSIPGTAAAHNLIDSYVYLDIFDSSVEGELHYPVPDLNEVLGLEIPNDLDGAVEWAEANPTIVQEYSADHFAMADLDGAPWPIVYTGFHSLEVGDGAYLVAEFEVDREFEEVPRQFTVTYDGIMHAKPERAALLGIATDFGSGTFNNEADTLLRYTSGNTTQTVDLGDTSFWSGITAVIALGVDHIRIGADHILFIIALVLPSVLVFTRRSGWQPAPGFGAGLWRVLKIVTMFTIAHTVTLTLGGLGIIELPSALVETVIAVSIILAALHNLRPVLVNREWLIAFGFGLIHGFGFAGLLSDLGLTQSRRVASLLGFNLGIELGQAAIIVLVFPALFLARRTRGYVSAMNVGSLILIGIAGAWAVERAFGVDLGTEWVMDRVNVWPRQLIPVALLYMIAGYAYWRDSSSDNLLPLSGGMDASTPEVAMAET